jgi:hypothetical protein
MPGNKPSPRERNGHMATMALTIARHSLASIFFAAKKAEVKVVKVL